MILIDTSTLTNQNLANYILVHLYTNATLLPQKIAVAVDISQIAGNGDYLIYASIQRAGAGAEFRWPRTTAPVDSGVTAISFPGTATLNPADKVRVYVKGLAGDTTTPDITTYVWEDRVETPAMQSTTIATLATQVSFTLTAGSADNDAYNGCFAIIEDAATAVQKAVVAISDYVGSTRTVTLVAAAPFTIATTDRITIFGQNLSGTTIKTATDVETKIDTLLGRITSGLFTGITSFAQWLGLLAGKQVGNTTARTELRATGAGSGTYDETFDSQEAIRDRGDAAWVTGGAGSAPTAAEIWANPQRTLTQSAAQVAAIMSGSTVTLLRGDSISFSLTGMGSLVGRSKLWITGKQNPADPDSAANFQIEETAGLLRIGGAAPITGETGTLTVTDAAAGDITVALSAAAAAKLKTMEDGKYDVQVKISTTVTTKTASTLNVTGDVTRVLA